MSTPNYVIRDQADSEDDYSYLDYEDVDRDWGGDHLDERPDYDLYGHPTFYWTAQDQESTRYAFGCACPRCASEYLWRCGLVGGSLRRPEVSIDDGDRPCRTPERFPSPLDQAQREQIRRWRRQWSAIEAAKYPEDIPF